MINQTPISAKIDSNQLSQFDVLCSSLGCKRNTMLNFLVAYANNMLRDTDKLYLIQAYAAACASEFESEH